MSEPMNLPAEIDLIQRQVGEARDLEAVREIKDRAEALRVYCHKHGGLMEAHNRIAGIIARCERRIGQELRETPRHPAGRPAKNRSEPSTDLPPTPAEIGITKNQSAEYQELASVEENVLLDAIDLAGAEGREITKKDIRKAVRASLGKQEAARPPEPEPDPDLAAAAEEWNAGMVHPDAA
jgi:hypothetical protein